MFLRSIFILGHCPVSDFGEEGWHQEFSLSMVEDSSRLLLSSGENYKEFFVTSRMFNSQRKKIVIKLEMATRERSTSQLKDFRTNMVHKSEITSCRNGT